MRQIVQLSGFDEIFAYTYMYNEQVAKCSSIIVVLRMKPG